MTDAFAPQSPKERFVGHTTKLFFRVLLQFWKIIIWPIPIFIIAIPFLFKRRTTEAALLRILPYKEAFNIDGVVKRWHVRKQPYAWFCVTHNERRLYGYKKLSRRNHELLQSLLKQRKEKKIPGVLEIPSTQCYDTRLKHLVKVRRELEAIEEENEEVPEVWVVITYTINFKRPDSLIDSIVWIKIP